MKAKAERLSAHSRCIKGTWRSGGGGGLGGVSPSGDPGESPTGDKWKRLCERLGELQKYQI